MPSPEDASVPSDTSVPEVDAGPVLDPGLDPNITFEWNETPPGTGMCGLGTFAGSFSCTFDDNPLSLVAGQVNFQLTKGGEVEPVLNGHLADPLGVGLPLFYVDLIGTLNCSNAVLDAFGTSGLAVVQLGMAAVTFDAELRGEYDPSTAEISGDVTLLFPPDQACEGTFSVGASP